MIPNNGFVDLMDTGSTEPPLKSPWAKVRWINICGLSWDVMKALSIAYDLHSLALEDVFHGNALTRSKADYYTQHLFLRVLCHQLVKPQEEDDSPSTYTTQRTASPELMVTLEEELLKEVNKSSRLPTSSLNGRTLQPLLPLNHAGTHPTKMNPLNSFSRLLQKRLQIQQARNKYKEQEVSLDALKQGERVNVDVFPLFMFLLRDGKSQIDLSIFFYYQVFAGTVVSLQPSADSDLTHPISQRLRSRDTVLTKTADPSLLVHSLLDITVDKPFKSSINTS